MTDPLNDIRQYSPAMTISQVLKFCEKKDIGITRGMIQNYIRDGLLPPPVNKRLYTHKHIAALVLIDKLKAVFDIPSIQKVLVPLMDDEGLPIDAYNDLINQTTELLRKWQIIMKQTEETTAYPLPQMFFAAELKALICGGGAHQ